MMPERLAATDPFKQMTEIVGSGPFRFLPDEYVSGIHARRSRSSTATCRGTSRASYNAGGHKVNVDRVEWRVIPDAATAAERADRRRSRLGGTAATRSDPDAEASATA